MSEILKCGYCGVSSLRTEDHPKGSPEMSDHGSYYLCQEHRDKSLLVSPWLIIVASLMVPVAAMGFILLPEPWDKGSVVVALVCALLAGVGSPQSHYSGPLIPLALVPSALSMSGALVLLAAALPNPLLQYACTMAATALAALAGKALPTPTKEPQ